MSMRKGPSCGGRAGTRRSPAWPRMAFLAHFPDLPDDLYNAACFLADASVMAAGAADLAEPGRRQQADAYALRRWTCCARPFKPATSTWRTCSPTGTSSPCASGRISRHCSAHSKALPAEDDEPRGAGPGVAAGIRRGTGPLRRADGGGPHDGRQAAARARAPQVDAFAERFLQLARQHPDSPAAVDALVWVLDHSKGPGEGGRRRRRAPGSGAKLREEAGVCRLLPPPGRDAFPGRGSAAAHGPGGAPPAARCAAWPDTPWPCP